MRRAPHFPKIDQDEGLALVRSCCQGEGIHAATGALNIERRELPMVEVEKDYAFGGRRASIADRHVRRSTQLTHTSCSTRNGTKAAELHRHRGAVAGLLRPSAHATRATPWCRVPSRSRGPEGEAVGGTFPGTPRSALTSTTTSRHHRQSVHPVSTTTGPKPIRGQCSD